MPALHLQNIAKRYQRQRLFEGITGTLEGGRPCAILGRNGSGKSTLMRILAGMQKPTTGEVLFSEGEGKPRPLRYHEAALCAPGMELPEELTIREALRFHFSMKKALPGMNAEGALQETGLAEHGNKQLADLSSGMKQRIKLMQAFASDTPLLLLDEPCTNLDDAGVAQYLDWCARFGKGRIVAVASNDPREYAFCEARLELG